MSEFNKGQTVYYAQYKTIRRGTVRQIKGTDIVVEFPQHFRVLNADDIFATRQEAAKSVGKTFRHVTKSTINSIRSKLDELSSELETLTKSMEESEATP